MLCIVLSNQRGVFLGMKHNHVQHHQKVAFWLLLSSQKPPKNYHLVVLGHPEKLVLESLIPRFPAPSLQKPEGPGGLGSPGLAALAGVFF